LIHLQKHCLKSLSIGEIKIPFISSFVPTKKTPSLFQKFVYKSKLKLKKSFFSLFFRGSYY
jgi:hypothetical protein